MDFFDIPVFVLNLQTKIELITNGTFEDDTNSLVCSTEGGKVLIYTPRSGADQSTQEVSAGNAELRTLSINGKITGIQAGKLNPDLSHDILAIGMETTVRAYDVVMNSDQYFVSVNEGVTCITLHPPADQQQPFLYAAGNGTIKGYNPKGEEAAWILSGEDVTCMKTYRTEPGEHGLLVATKNSKVLFFKGDECAFSISESDNINNISVLSRGTFGFILGTNTVGVYRDTKLVWKHTFTSEVTAIHAFDADNDGYNELIIGLKNGTLECRRAATGAVQSKGAMEDGIIAMCRWSSSASEQSRLAIATRNGIVKGFRPSMVALPDLPDPVVRALRVSTSGAAEGTLSLDSSVAELTAFLNRKKVDLEKDVAQMEELIKETKKKNSDDGNSLPSTTEVKLGCKTNEVQRMLEAYCTTNNDVYVRGLCLFSDLIYPQGSHLFFADPPSNSVHVPLRPPKYKALTIKAKVIAGMKGSDIYHVFDAELPLKKFPLHVCVNESMQINSYVSFVLNDRIGRVVHWLSEVFPLKVKETQLNELSVFFRCFGDVSDSLAIEAQQNQTGGVKIVIRGTSMETIAEVAQEIFDSFGVKEMESLAHFPEQMENFKKLFARVIDLNRIRQQLTADIAERTSSAKIAIVKAEDARIIGDLVSMKTWLANLESENNELLKGYLIRQKNHEELLASVREVNKIIQFASRFRRGKAQARIITEARKAVRENRIDSLQKIIETGTAEAK